MLGGLFTHVGHSSASQLLTDFTCQKRFEPGLLLDYGQKLNGAKGVQPLFTCKPVWHATRAGLPHARDKSGVTGCRAMAVDSWFLCLPASQSFEQQSFCQS